MTKTLVEKMGGVLYSESIPKVGTVFMAQIPLETALLNEATMASMVKRKTDSKKGIYNIMVCSDEPFSTELRETMVDESISILPFSEDIVRAPDFTTKVDAVVLDKECSRTDPATSVLAPYFASNLLLIILNKDLVADPATGEANRLYLVSNKPAVFSILKKDFLKYIDRLRSNVGVLIVDDDEFNLKVLTKFVASDGYSVVFTAVNGDEAYRVYREEANRIRIILMDNETPFCNGPTATRRILSYQKSAQMPPVRIIGVTGNVLESQLNECLQAGMHQVLKKPVTMDQLCSSILKNLKNL
jgi:CheY-like chemotaxis protein